MFAGIDLGGDWLHCVSLDGDGRLARSGLLPAGQLDRVIDWAAKAQVLAVDAPAQLSVAPHINDETLSPKFQRARCAEIALGRERRVWVSWVTPLECPESGWISTGLRVHEALQELGVPVLEIYPHGGYRELAGGAQLPKKQTAEGLQARARLLIAAGVQGDHLDMWSHDGLDALLGALVALHYGRGDAIRIGCGHDESAIWLPRAQTRRIS
jgi:predicted nuclease with RNAse H fold